MPIQVAPSLLAMKTEECLLMWAALTCPQPTFIQVVQPQAIQTRQIVHVVGLPRVVFQRFKTFNGCTQRILS